MNIYATFFSISRITCTNQVSASNKSLVVATQGSPSYKDNIACVFGIKQLQSIFEIKTEKVANIKENIFKGLSGEVKDNGESINIEDVEIDLSEDSNDAQNDESKSSQEIITNTQKSQGYRNIPDPVELVGYISSCEHGFGRSSTDRQFFYVNSRPCEPTKVMKLVNEIYRQYNPNQYPFVFLNINVNRISVDVNVTPDKRKVFLTKEKYILDCLKASLLKLFEHVPRTLKIDSTTLASQKLEPELKQPRIFNSFIQQFSNQPKESSDIKDINSPTKSELKRKSITTLDDFLSVKKSYTLHEETSIESEKINETELETSKNDDSSEFRNDAVNQNATKIYENNITNVINTTNKEVHRNSADISIKSTSDIVQKVSHTIYCKTSEIKTPKAKIHKVVTDKEDLGKHVRKTVNLKTSLEQIKKLADLCNKNDAKTNPDRIKFKSMINPVFNKKCEEELSREISKESFKRMSIVGQFNLGFIITKLEDDLFIIDQHATDEIYNFETLQKTTELTSQKLVM